MNKNLLFIYLILTTVLFFFSLITVEVLLMAWVENNFVNSLSFPIFEFKNVARIAWSQAPWATTREWLSQPTIEIGFRNESSGLYMWAIYYHLPAIISHLVVAITSALYFYKLPTNSYSPKILAFIIIAMFLLIIPTFYLSIAAHCSGPNWILNVLIRAFQSSAVNTAFILQRLAIDVPAMYLVFQWILFTAGIFIHIMLFRSLDALSSPRS